MNHGTHFRALESMEYTKHRRKTAPAAIFLAVFVGSHLFYPSGAFAEKRAFPEEKAAVEVAGTLLRQIEKAGRKQSSRGVYEKSAYHADPAVELDLARLADKTRCVKARCLQRRYHVLLDYSLHRYEKVKRRMP